MSAPVSKKKKKPEPPFLYCVCLPKDNRVIMLGETNDLWVAAHSLQEVVALHPDAVQITYRGEVAIAWTE